MPIVIVNMIPNSLSGETNRDSEPNIAVNPANPLQIAASAFTPDPASSGNGPIFVSTDGGNTWALNIKLPGGNRTVDASMRFGGTSGVLYAGILRSDNSNLNILRTNNYTGAGLMDILINRANDDQPWVEAATVMGGAGVGQDRVYVSNNDTSQGTTTGRTASVDFSLNAATGAAPAGFVTTARIETRATASTGPSSSQDGPSVRTAIHPNGAIYGAYFGWRTFGTPNVSDVVVVRDDGWANGATPFQALVDPGDAQPGMRVVTGVQIVSLSTKLGTQRIGSQIAIAVDPRDSRAVYLAWCDGNSAANYTIHVRRSTDGGQTWSTDLRTITSATNPGLAINTRGKVALLYQQLGNPGTGNRWRTHLELSDNGFSSAPTDLILADVPDANGSYTGSNPIGDYANVIAVGKDFYGVFSANNTPNNANFPNGVTYQRNANFTTNVLLANDGVTPIAVSIDPFFFHWTEVLPEDDFYVRDWTDNATSGDTGLEPSTHPVFFATSDVWNRRGSLPGIFVNDQPSNEDAGNGAGTLGDNWAFARIRRNAPAATGSKTVTAHFLVSKLGTGSNYADAGSADPDVSFPDPDPTVTFNSADVGPIITPAYHWHLNPVSSSHLCLAVEIFAPGDPFVPPSLVGRAPGWPATDLALLFDNNKAQRNMGLSTTPARGVGNSDSFFAIAHNAATYSRDMILHYYVPTGSLKRLQGAKIALIGGKTFELRAEGTIVLKDMSPGENRWIGLVFTPPRGKEHETIAVYFFEDVNGIVINGFGLGTRLASVGESIIYALKQHLSVFTRLHASFHSNTHENNIKHLMKLLRQRNPKSKEYVAFLHSGLEEISHAVNEQLEKDERMDVFGLASALKTLQGSLRQQKLEDIQVAHIALLNRMDSQLTMLLLKEGDPDDILQTVRWTRDLFTRPSRVTELVQAEGVRALCDEFINAYGQRHTTNRDYPEMLDRLVSLLKDAAAELHDKAFARAVEGIERSTRAAGNLQKMHRQALLELQRLATMSVSQNH